VFLSFIDRNKLKIHEIGVDSANSVLLTQINHLEETDSKINCMDFNRADDKLVYGCSNGIVKVRSWLQFKFIKIFFL
jgi:hypothetical protein